VDVSWANHRGASRGITPAKSRRFSENSTANRVVLLWGLFQNVQSLGRLCGGLRLLWLEAVQVVDSALRKSCGLEDCAGVILEDLKPCGDVGRVVFLDLRRDFEIGAKERGAQLGNEFLAGIVFVAPDLAA
jgi:hypothetical protein